MKKIKILLALQLRALFAASRRRQGKTRSAGIKVLMALAFLYVGGVMMFLFGAMAYGLVSTLRGLGLGWMALAMGAFISAALSFILTVFSMQSQIFSAKDNDMLFAMPLTGLQIGASRMLSLLLLEYAYSALVMIPTVGVYGYLMRPSFAFYPLMVLLLLLLPLLPLSLAGAVGYLFALLTRKCRFKNLIISLLSGAAFLAYLYACFHLNDYMALLIAKGADLAEVFRRALPPFYHFAIALQEYSLGSVLAVAAWCLVPAALFLWLLSKGFFYLTGSGGSKVAYKRRPLKVNRPWVAVFRKEAARLGSLPMYLFNAAIGALFMVALSLVVAIRGQSVLEALFSVPQLAGFVPQALQAALCFCAAMICTTAPSVSLEGNRLWILRSSPLRPQDVFLGKLALDLALLVPSVLISVALLAVSVPLSPWDLLALLALPLALGTLVALVGLYANLKLPRFDYTSDTAVIKQSASVMVASLGGMGLVIALVLLYVLLGYRTIGYFPYCGLAFAALAAGCWLLWRRIQTEGVKCWEEF